MKETKMQPRTMINRALVLGLVLVLAMLIKVDTKAATWRDDGGQWFGNKKCIYISENNLCISPVQPHSMGVRDNLATWKMNTSTETLRIVTIYQNKVYVVRYKESGKSTLYSVDISKKKKKKVATDCCAFSGKGKYIYGNAFKVSDSGAYPVFVWKVNGNSVQKVKTIGKYIFGTTIVGNNVYYASYPNGSQKKMTVYRCNLDGSKTKKLFQLKAKGQYSQALITDVNAKSIKATVSTSKGIKIYEYTIKNKKLKKIR